MRRWGARRVESLGSSTQKWPSLSVGPGQPSSGAPAGPAVVPVLCHSLLGFGLHIGCTALPVLGCAQAGTDVCCCPLPWTIYRFRKLLPPARPSRWAGGGCGWVRSWCREGRACEAGLGVALRGLHWASSQHATHIPGPASAYSSAASRAQGLTCPAGAPWILRGTGRL